jgi:hypothetical protein
VQIAENLQVAVDMLFKENVTWPELIKQIRIMSEGTFSPLKRLRFHIKAGGGGATIGSTTIVTARSTR